VAKVNCADGPNRDECPVSQSHLNAANTRFSDNPTLSRRTRAALLAVLSVAYFVVIVVSLTENVSYENHDRQPSVEAYSVPLDPPPPPSPAPSPVPASQPAGEEGASAKRAKPKAIVAPPTRIPNRTTIAAPAASTGDATRSGANSAGAGTGGGVTGLGTGSGGSGDGSGAGAQRAVKIAGDINATRDFPARSRDLRLGSNVIIVLTVGTDGRVHGCRIHKPSPDSEADAITCRLATERFRFRPATDRAGNPIEAPFGWQQRWFAP